MMYLCGYPMLRKNIHEYPGGYDYHLFGIHDNELYHARAHSMNTPDFCGGVIVWSPQVMVTALHGSDGGLFGYFLDRERSEQLRSVVPEIYDKRFMGSAALSTNNRRLMRPSCVMQAALCVQIQASILNLGRTHMTMWGPVDEISAAEAHEEVNGSSSVEAHFLSYRKMLGHLGGNSVIVPAFNGSNFYDHSIYLFGSKDWEPKAVVGGKFRNGNTGRLCASFSYGFEFPGDDEEEFNDAAHDVENFNHGCNTLVGGRVSGLEDVEEHGYCVEPEPAYEALSFIRDHFDRGDQMYEILRERSIDTMWGNG